MTAKLNRTDLRATIVAAIISTIIAVIAQFVASRSIALEFRRLEKLEETYAAIHDVEHAVSHLLEGEGEAHQALAQRFTRSSDVALTPEQLETLRALGYIQ